MLKALELIGFKSFADKTRFEFPRGITAVVGPNGSGKSNVVDAIKWVLGEQSVKSLRGKEMVDVIFNGSTGRQPLNSAEVTLIFDNSQRLLAVDTPEVHVTRRVYRNGEGEYLINRQPSRLRDIRDLFSGTGIATEAYSVIEQGKVDVLLQSSPRDRRVIFEEAAGISRFKAKKIESLRRLERVEQNLLRMADIVEEVEGRLRSVRHQAGKARRYREHAERLQALRTQTGLADWRKLTHRLDEAEAKLRRLDDENAQFKGELERLDEQGRRHDAEHGELRETLRGCDAKIAANRERITAGETAIEHQRARLADLEEQAARHRRQLTAMSHKAGDLLEQLQATESAVHAAEGEHSGFRGELANHERALTEITTELDALRDRTEARRNAYVAEMRSAAKLGGDLAGFEAKVGALKSAVERAKRRLAELDTARQATIRECEQLGIVERDLAESVAGRIVNLAAAQDELSARRRELADQTQRLGSLRQRESGAAERAAVLEELEQRREGVSTGVKDVLDKARSGDAAWKPVRGLVAEVLHAQIEVAPLIDAALGDAAQHVVVDAGPDWFATWDKTSSIFTGRVGFVRLVGAVGSERDSVDLSGLPRVIGRADRFVETTGELAPLCRRLLATTWLVERLADAVELASSLESPVRFVSRAGELLDADGTLVVGPRIAATGLVSRRSELRALRTRIDELRLEIASAEEQVRRSEALVESADRDLHATAVIHQRAVDAHAEATQRAESALERLERTAAERVAADTELSSVDAQHKTVSASLSDCRTRLVAAEVTMHELERSLADEAARIEELDRRRHEKDGQATAAKVELAKSDERLENFRAQLRQLHRDRQDRRRTLDEVESQLVQAQRRAAEAELAILTGESELASLYLHNEARRVEAAGLALHADQAKLRRAELTARTQELWTALRAKEDEQHALQLAAQEIAHERKGLALRLREDYGIELAQLERELQAEELHQRDEIDREIDDLRRKLNQMGNVNLDALDELNQLEARHGGLVAQYQDLTSAKRSIEQIIERINADSRRLFGETLETVRGHFQNLFRLLFGGGQADIVMERDVDILDSGIEIVARPPGKEPRSISLLSGGEKTLTCVAMLLAIFKSRPSPFCVLDEVDAALDEANIERFILALQEFLAWTQFVVVTHSKKTMTCATTLHGVTMQESGVSKRVSVRFDDVSDTGEILLVDGPRAGEAA